MACSSFTFFPEVMAVAFLTALLKRLFLLPVDDDVSVGVVVSAAPDVGVVAVSAAGPPGKEPAGSEESSAVVFLEKIHWTGPPKFVLHSSQAPAGP